MAQHFVGPHANAEAKGSVAVVEVEPIMLGLQGEGRCQTDGLMARGADLKIGLIVLPKGDLPVVQTTGEVHLTIRFDEGLRGETVVFFCHLGGSRRLLPLREGAQF